MAIDDYYKDPTVASGSLFARTAICAESRIDPAFHDGRLTNFLILRQHRSLASYEFAGFVREWDGDDMILKYAILLNPDR